LRGQAVVNLSAPRLGKPFQGVALVQLSSNPISFSGQAIVTIAGVVYAPNALVSITGSGVGNPVVTINEGVGTVGTTTQPPILGALIAFDLKVDGKGKLIINT